MITSLLSISLTIRPQLLLGRVRAQAVTAGHTLQRIGFDLSLVHMGFVVDKGVLGQGFFK